MAMFNSYVSLPETDEFPVDGQQSHRTKNPVISQVFFSTLLVYCKLGEISGGHLEFMDTGLELWIGLDDVGCVKPKLQTPAKKSLLVCFCKTRPSITSVVIMCEPMLSWRHEWPS